MFHMPQKKIPDLLLKIENVALERVKTFNFLGITLHEHLKWDTHINSISNKISRVIGTINRLKHYIPPNILLTLYNSLILPRLYYGILIWGHGNTDRIIKLQKKAVRIISGSAYNAHSEPSFKILRLLKLQDIHTLQQHKFTYQLINKDLPSLFHLMLTSRNQDIHTHNTRNKHNIVIPKIKHEFARKCIRNQIHDLINNSPRLIIDKMDTHSFKGFVLYVKCFYFDGYSPLCIVPNCLICNQT